MPVVRTGAQRLGAVAIILLLLALLIDMTSGSAVATHQPADKIAASGSTIEVMSPGENVTLLSGTIKTSSVTDLIFQVALECTIITDLKTVGNDESGAEAKVDVWVTVDGVPVPVTAIAENGGPDNGRITFCDRTFRRTTTNFSDDGDDTPDTIEDFLRTKSTHGFNWIRLNLGNKPAPHRIEVKATLTHALLGNEMGNAQAIVGKRTLLVLPAKLANDAII